MLSQLPRVLASVAIGVVLGPLIRAEVCRAIAGSGRRQPLACPQCSATVGCALPWERGTAILWSGTCTACAARVGPPRILIELISAAMLGVLAVAVEDVVALIAFGWMAACGLVLAAVDVATHRLPNKFTLLLALGAGLVITFDAALDDSWARAIEAGGCGVAAGGFYTMVSIATRGGIGLGDAKLAFGLAFVAGWAGWPAAALAITLGLILTGLTGIVLLLFTRASRKDSLPHGPFMVAGSVAAVLLANIVGSHS